MLPASTKDFLNGAAIKAAMETVWQETYLLKNAFSGEQEEAPTLEDVLQNYQLCNKPFGIKMTTEEQELLDQEEEERQQEEKAAALRKRKQMQKQKQTEDGDETPEDTEQQREEGRDRPEDTDNQEMEQ